MVAKNRDIENRYRTVFRWLALCLLGASSVCLGTPVAAQTTAGAAAQSQGYSLDWWAVDAGQQAAAGEALPAGAVHKTAVAADESMVAPAAAYAIDWWTVDGGGLNTVSSGGYTLSSTAGQPDAQTVSAGGYTLSGGFWAGGTIPPNYRVYLPIVTRHNP